VTSEDIEAILSLGTIDEEIAELLRQKLEAEDEGKATRGRESGHMAGRVYVANPGQAIADMFIRGKAEKKAKAAEDAAKARRGDRDRITGDYIEGLLGKRIEPVPVTASRIGTAPGTTPPAAPPPVMGAAPQTPQMDPTTGLPVNPEEALMKLLRAPKAPL